MKKKWIKWVIAIVVLLALAVAGKVLLGGTETARYAEDTAITGNLTTYYNFSGSLDVDKSATVYAPADTTVAELYVSPNAIVAKNARLMRLDDGSILKADIAGEVTSIAVVNGSVVKKGDALLEIMDLNSMKATFKVDEYDVPSITIGKTVKITVDGSGSAFEGTVSALNKRATQSGDLSYYTATVELKGIQLPANALPGMQISVDALNQNVENAVLLNMDSIGFTAKNDPYVLMRDGKNVKEVPVSLGVNDGSYVQITEGLRSGDVVLYTPTSPKSFEEIMTNRSNSAMSGAQQ